MHKWNRNNFWTYVHSSYNCSMLTPFQVYIFSLSAQLHLSDPVGTHFQSPLEFWPDRIDLTTVLLSRMSEQVTDLTEHIFRLIGGRGTSYSSSPCLYSICDLSVLSWSVPSWWAAFRHPQLCLREGCSNSKDQHETSSKNILSSISAKGWPVFLFRSRPAFSAV